LSTRVLGVSHELHSSCIYSRAIASGLGMFAA